MGASDLAFTLHSGCLRSEMKIEEDILVSGNPMCFYNKSEINVYPSLCSNDRASLISK